MKKRTRPADPLGERPKPITGLSEPNYLNDELRTKSSTALTACEEVWVPHSEQDIVIAKIRAYIDGWARAADKSNAGGRRLSQYSQAGKSATMKRLKLVLAEASARAGLQPNKHQVVIVTLKKRMTLKSLYREILRKLGDPHHDQERVETDTLLQRIRELSQEVGLELLVIDEVQHLDNKSKDATAILDQLKTFVDEGLFPTVFVGDEESIDFFERNAKLAARLGEPLELRPMEPLNDDELGARDAIAFRRFCDRFDDALKKSGAIGRLAGLKEKSLLDGLILASGGHVGRVARILQVAVAFAAWRDAETVEAFDLSHAVRSFAMKNQWIDHDPYSARA